MLLIIILAFITGCACPNKPRYYTPDMLQASCIFYRIPPFKAVDKIKIINAQPTKKDKMGYYRHIWRTDLNKWTDSAIFLVSDILRQRGAEITDASKKKIALSITDVDISWGFSQITCSVNLNVSLSDGYQRLFYADYTSKDIYDSCNGALISAVSSMFFDKHIFSYVSKNSLIKD